MNRSAESANERLWGLAARRRDMNTAARLLPRLVRYQVERFPLTAYAPLVAIASVAAIGWSRAARGAAGYVSTSHGVTAALTMLTAFAVLRVADEHKDAALDRVARPELPVPRGLVTLGELRLSVSVAIAAVVALNAYLMPVALLPLAAVALWTALMTREFFVPEWLRAHPALYLVSHMVILPLILLYGSTVDWLTAGDAAGWAFAASVSITAIVLLMATTSFS